MLPAPPISAPLLIHPPSVHLLLLLVWYQQLPIPPAAVATGAGAAAAVDSDTIATAGVVVPVQSVLLLLLLCWLPGTTDSVQPDRAGAGAGAWSCSCCCSCCYQLQLLPKPSCDEQWPAAAPAASRRATSPSEAPAEAADENHHLLVAWAVAVGQLRRQLHLWSSSGASDTSRGPVLTAAAPAVAQ